VTLPVVSATYPALVTLPATLTVTDHDDATGDHLVWGKGPDGATYRMPLTVFVAVYGGAQVHQLDRAELTVPAPS
jgi:hypothetical protein